MLGKKISAPRKAISVFDPSFFEFSAEQREKYLVSRDIADLGGEEAFASMAAPPAVFTLDPLKVEHSHLLDSDGFLTLSVLFRMYVTDVTGFEISTEVVNGVRSMTEASFVAFGSEVVREMGGLIQDFARSDTTPFLPPDGFRATASAALARRALMGVTSRTPASSTTD